MFHNVVEKFGRLEQNIIVERLVRGRALSRVFSKKYNLTEISSQHGLNVVPVCTPGTAP